MLTIKPFCNIYMITLTCYTILNLEHSNNHQVYHHLGCMIKYKEILTFLINYYDFKKLTLQQKAFWVRNWFPFITVWIPYCKPPKFLKDWLIHLWIWMVRFIFIRDSDWKYNDWNVNYCAGYHSYHSSGHKGKQNCG